MQILQQLVMAGSRHVILTPIEDGWWMAEVPSLPGCATQGATKAEALANVVEAIEGVILTLQDHGRPVPDDVPIQTAIVAVP